MLHSHSVILFNSRTPEHSWLSNFHRIAGSQLWVLVDEDTTARADTAEHVYQAMKFSPGPMRALIMRQPTAAAAKRAGRSGVPRPDWYAERTQLMRLIVHDKFTRHPYLCAKLLATGDQRLAHLSPWDLFWGVDDAGKGQDQLGRMIMQVRLQLKRDLN